MKTVIFIYIFTFACLFKIHAAQPQPKVQKQEPKDCIKHPQIVKPQSSEKQKVVAEKVAKAVTPSRGSSSIPHFSVLNFINFFYTKDTLDNLHVM